MLAAKAVDSAAQRIADKLPNKTEVNNISCKPKNISCKPKILLYESANTPDFQAYIMFNAQVKVVDTVLKTALTESETVRITHSKSRTMASPAAIGLALSAVNNILGYFRTDYAVAGVALKSEDSMLVHALAEKIAARGYNVQLPAIYNPDVHSTASSDFVEKLVALAEKQQRARSLFEFHQAEAAKDKVSAEQKEMHIKTAAVLDAAVALFDAFFSKLTTAVDGETPLSDVLLEASLVKILKQNACLLIVEIQKIGGAHYTKKNIGTLFGRMPFYHMGGVVVSFVLLNGGNGSVEKSGVVPIHGGFVKADKIEAHIN